jgi:hypothetical protein
MLGDLAPRAAARTAPGREKLAVWLKHLENRSRQQPNPKAEFAGISMRCDVVWFITY